VAARLALATLLLQLLAFAWIGAVWGLEGLAQIITQSAVASRIVGWIQGQWFAVLAAWSVLFFVVCGLFRLARPILAWHQRTIAAAAHFDRLSNNRRIVEEPNAATRSGLTSVR